MHFQAGTVIQDHRSERRWQVVGPLEQLPNLKRWAVRDQAPGMERDIQLLTLDYSELPARDRDFAIQRLRDDLMRVAQILGEGGYNFLPAPIDLITFDNQHDPMEAELRSTEIGLVLAQTSGKKLLPLRTDRDGRINVANLRRLIVATLKTMRLLHDRKVVMQAVARTQVTINPVTQLPYFKGIQTLMFMGDFNGFNPNRAGLSPSRVFAAPECFDPNGRLTPATDIYAVGKLAMQLLLDQDYVRHFTPQNPCPSDVQTLINALGLPEPWPRFLAMCLQPDPRQRFQNTLEAEQFLLPNETIEAIKKAKAEAAGKPSSAAAAKTANKTFWSYRENPQLPEAMLLIWGERLTAKNQMFNYRKLYEDLALNYNLKPRLFFQTHRQGPVSDNPFFSMLQNQYGLEVIPLDGTQDPIGVLNHALDPHLANIRHLILVGGADEAGVQCLLQHPNAADWRIHWIRGAGNWNPSLAVERVTDAAKYIRAKKP
ncbi:hypothetical protein [Allochromatium vinosum]|uniref:hypothetical protein n=1 Tax=Allochromatium vinosum TaxID=1049 RepID=UPI001907D886|nr:hypothetical protein [Allochromatium vinosum]MBK1654876.1 hypothetical protein [Allochromatium vinosum]